MRAVFVLLLAVVGLAFLAPTASAAPAKNYTSIAIFNDSACTLPVEELQVPLDLSAKCVVPEGGHNESWAFGCATTKNQTDAIWLVYNGTSTCSGSPSFTWATSGPAGGCNPMAFIYAGGKVATMYGYTTCAASKPSPLDTMLDITERYGFSIAAPAFMEERKEEEAPQQPERAFFKRLRRGDKQDA